MKTLNFLLSLLLVFLVSLFAVSCKECEHVDKDDNGLCDILDCNAAFSDGCDTHVDANDDGECDTNGCEVQLNDGCDVHRDADDNGICDKDGCDITFTDGCDIHRDIDDDGVCDNGNEPFLDDADIKSYTVTVSDSKGNIVKNVEIALYGAENSEIFRSVSDKYGKINHNTWRDVVYVKITSIPFGYEELNVGAKYTFDSNSLLLTLKKVEFSDYEGDGGTKLPVVPNN